MKKVLYLKNGTSYSLICDSDVTGELCNAKLFELNNGQEYVAQTYKKDVIYLYVSPYSNSILGALGNETEIDASLLH